MSHGTALIIGVGPGLGFALARTFHDAGHPVALFSRNSNRLDELAADLYGEPPVSTHAVDVADPTALRAAIDAAVAEGGAPEVLLYNAAVMREDRPTGGTDADWANALAVNVTGAKVAAEHTLAAMNGQGSLLFTGGGFAHHPSPHYTSLSVGKAALLAYVQTLAADSQTQGVRASVVSINGAINSGPETLSANTIAQTYLELHREPSDRWQTEVSCS